MEECQLALEERVASRVAIGGWMVRMSRSCAYSVSLRSFASAKAEIA